MDFCPTVKSVRKTCCESNFQRGRERSQTEKPSRWVYIYEVQQLCQYVSIQPILAPYNGNKYQTFFTWNGKSLPKIKPPPSFFSLKVLEYIMEITLNHKFCGQTTFQSLSAANSGFHADMNLFEFPFPLISYCKIIGSFSATLSSAFLKKIRPKEMKFSMLYSWFL